MSLGKEAHNGQAEIVVGVGLAQSRGTVAQKRSFAGSVLSTSRCIGTRAELLEAEIIKATCRSLAPENFIENQEESILFIYSCTVDVAFVGRHMVLRGIFTGRGNGAGAAGIIAGGIAGIGVGGIAMWLIPPSTRIYVCRTPADMRRSFDGLCGMTRDILQQEPTSGHLFVFFNRRGDRVKVLYFDRTGLAIWYKRLEQGRFHLPSGAATVLEMTAADLTCVLDGIDLSHAKRRKRFSLPVKAAGKSE